MAKETRTYCYLYQNEDGASEEIQVEAKTHKEAEKMAQELEPDILDIEHQLTIYGIDGQPYNGHN